MNLLSEPATILTLVPKPTDPPHFWWVNQRQNFEDEARNGVLRAPLRRHECYVNVERLRRGDIVVHHVAGLIRAVGVVACNPVEMRDPLGIESGRIRVGKVSYHLLDQPVVLADLPDTWKLDENAREALVVRGDALNCRPFDCHGGAIQAYLFGLSENFIQHLLEVPEFAGAFERATGGQGVLKEAR